MSENQFKTASRDGQAVRESAVRCCPDWKTVCKVSREYRSTEGSCTRVRKKRTCYQGFNHCRSQGRTRNRKKHCGRGSCTERCSRASSGGVNQRTTDYSGAYSGERFLARCTDGCWTYKKGCWTRSIQQRERPHDWNSGKPQERTGEYSGRTGRTCALLTVSMSNWAWCNSHAYFLCNFFSVIVDPRRPEWFCLCILYIWRMIYDSI